MECVAKKKVIGVENNLMDINRWLSVLYLGIIIRFAQLCR